MLLRRCGVFVCWMELKSVKLFVLWVLFLLLPSSMWTNSPSKYEPLLLHAFGRSEGLFGSPSRCCYYWGLLPSWRHDSQCDCWGGGAGKVVCSSRNPWRGRVIYLNNIEKVWKLFFGEGLVSPEFFFSKLDYKFVERIHPDDVFNLFNWNQR